MTQCSARAKSTGERCRCSAIRGGTVCHKHGGSAPQVKRKARERILLARNLACERLVEQLAANIVEPRETITATRDLSRTLNELDDHEAGSHSASVVDDWLATLRGKAGA
jgi:hypothetical protein